MKSSGLQAVGFSCSLDRFGAVMGGSRQIKSESKRPTSPGAPYVTEWLSLSQSIYMLSVTANQNKLLSGNNFDLLSEPIWFI